MNCEYHPKRKVIGTPTNPMLYRKPVEYILPKTTDNNSHTDSTIPTLDELIPNLRKVPKEDLLFVAENLLIYN
jgi:hypothetical protein